MLNHACTAGNEVAIVNHLKEYLRRYVVWIVACQHKLPASEHLSEVHTQKVALDDGVLTLVLKQRSLQISNALAVNLHHLQRSGLSHQILRHHTHAWAYFEHRQVAIRLVHRISYALGNVQVNKEVLTEVLFRSYLLHACKVSANRAKCKINLNLFSFPRCRLTSREAKSYE